MPRRHHDPDVVAALLAAPTVTAGAEALGITRWVAYDHLRAAGVNVGHFGRSGVGSNRSRRIDDALRSLLAGEPLPTIAARLGVEPKTALLSVGRRLAKAARRGAA